MSICKEVEINGRIVKFEFNKFAKQANGSVMVSSGRTQVLVTVCASPKNLSGESDFFPLAVEYIEKAYASGRIPGGYLKRESRPSDAQSLTARVLDRPLRPSFPKEFCNETVVSATVMSYEPGFSPVPLALVGASTALMISDIPFNGPIAALRVGLKDGEYIIDPLEGEEHTLDLDLNIACSEDAVLMVEAGAKGLSEEKVLQAIDFAHKSMAPYFAMQREIQKEIGKKKWELESVVEDKTLRADLEKYLQEPLKESCAVADKQERQKSWSLLVRDVLDNFNPDSDPSKKFAIKEALEDIKSVYLRQMILKDNVRLDGRSLEQIRPIACEINVLKSSHGSALFTRGETQALASVTLGTVDEAQRSESLWSGDIREPFMLHYNFPPYSVGEARMQRAPGRREIGHGSLAKRALRSVMPGEKDFNYAIRVVSEVLESNGSSSMATVCAATMAMLNAGIPLKKPVAGIAMGLIKEGDNEAVLSDILGDEDHLGDMDFKVCGTREGITALQMDIKISGLSAELLARALEQAKAGRNHILDKIDAAVSTVEKISEMVPRTHKMKIKSEAIRDLIGPGGKNIKKISQDTGVKIEVDDSGIVTLMANDILSAQAAKSLVRIFTAHPKIGDIYLGTATKIFDFAAVVEIKPGVEGTCHLSQLSEEKISHPKEVIKEGQEVLVKIVDIDKQGRLKLSRNEAIGQMPTFGHSGTLTS
jgi:polyribonucleotide nucleotidyltransferase